MVIMIESIDVYLYINYRIKELTKVKYNSNNDFLKRKPHKKRMTHLSRSHDKPKPGIIRKDSISMVRGKRDRSTG